MKSSISVLVLIFIFFISSILFIYFYNCSFCLYISILFWSYNYTYCSNCFNLNYIKVNFFLLNDYFTYFLVSVYSLCTLRLLLSTDFLFTMSSRFYILPADSLDIWWWVLASGLVKRRRKSIVWVDGLIDIFWLCCFELRLF